MVWPPLHKVTMHAILLLRQEGLYGPHASLQDMLPASAGICAGDIYVSCTSLAAGGVVTLSAMEPPVMMGCLMGARQGLLQGGM